MARPHPARSATRSGLREAVYAPKLAAAVAGVLAADPTLEDKITAYVQTHEVIMMLQLRGDAIKLGFTNAAEASDAAQELMRLDPNLSAGGAVIKVGFATVSPQSPATSQPALRAPFAG